MTEGKGPGPKGSAEYPLFGPRPFTAPSSPKATAICTNLPIINLHCLYRSVYEKHWCPTRNEITLSRESLLENPHSPALRNTSQKIKKISTSTSQLFLNWTDLTDIIKSYRPSRICEHWEGDVRSSCCLLWWWSKPVDSETTYNIRFVSNIKQRRS